MTPRIRSIAVPFLVALLAACSSPSPEPNLYLLRGDPSEGTGRIDGRVRVGLGRVVVAPYLLASPGIVVETEPGQVRPARMERWAEPLDAGVRWFVRSEVARALDHEVGGGLTDAQAWDYTIDLYIGRLHGAMSGEALIESVWVVRPDVGDVDEYRFTKRVPLAEAGYPGLVAAEQQLLEDLSRAIADSLAPRLKGGPTEGAEAPEPEPEPGDEAP